MAQADRQNDMSKRGIVYQPSGVEQVIIRKDVRCQVPDSDLLVMDIYYPPGPNGRAALPVVVFVFGYPDSVTQAARGCKIKEMGAYTSWGRATAATGLIAITYEVSEPMADIHKLLAYIHQNAHSLGLDEHRIGIWACSGNVPVALTLLMQENGAGLKCAVLYYGFMLDSEGSNAVAAAARNNGFANPCAGKTVADLSDTIPLLIVRAGQDSARLNQTIDRFVAGAITRNLPVTFINYPAGVHAFDLYDNSERSRTIISQTLGFLQSHLLK